MKIGDLLEKFKDRKLNKINLVYGRELLLIDNLVDAFRDLAKDYFRPREGSLMMRQSLN